MAMGPHSDGRAVVRPPCVCIARADESGRIAKKSADAPAEAPAEGEREAPLPRAVTPPPPPPADWVWPAEGERVDVEVRSHRRLMAHSLPNH